MQHKILIIDDEINIANQTAELLASSYEVFIANDGQTGMKSIEEKKPELILLDWFLKGTLQGEDVLKFAKEKYPHIPVYVTTGSVDKQSKALALGADEFLKKPCFEIEKYVAKAFELD